MGDRYNLSSQAGNPTFEFASAGSKSCYCSSKHSRDSLEAPHSKLLQVTATVENALDWNPARHNTSSDNGVEWQQLENERRTSSHGRDDVVTANFGFVGSSFRSEDSEALALWEEKSEKSPKAVSTDLSWLKSTESHSPWLGSVSNAVKKIESLSHAWARSSPVHPKVDAMVDSPRPSLEYLKKGGGRSSWRDFKIVSSPMTSTETVLHNTPKARYNNVSLCRMMDRNESGSSLRPTSPPKLRHAVSCAEIQFGSSAAPRPVDLSLRKEVDDEGDSCQDKRVEMNENKFESSCMQPLIQLERSSNEALSNPESAEASVPQKMPARARSLNLCKLEDTGNVPQTIAAAAERALLQQSTKVRVEVVSSSVECCSSMIRSHSIDEAMLNEYASEAGGQQARAETLHSQGAGEPKRSHRYYQRVTSRGRCSCWSSCDDTPLDHIDFVAPSAARFLEDEGCASPVKSPVKTLGAVPFKWEKEPGKPKEDSDTTTSAQSRSALQLPPRLALRYRKQYSSPLRDRYINMSMSAPLAELYGLPSQQSSSSEFMKVQLPWISRSFETTSRSSICTASLDRSPCVSSITDSPMRKSRSVGEVGSGLQTLSRFSVAGDAEDQVLAQKPCTENAQQPEQHKPAHLSGDLRPPSPTSILCGPDDGSHPSSNLSLSSEHEVPQISATTAPALSPRIPSCVSFDSLEHSSELISPESSLISPLRANSRCNSMSYNPDFDDMRKYLSTDYPKGAPHRENAFVKFCKTGRRWMKTKTHSKLGTIYSPEVWTPGITLQFQRNADADFSARLGKISSPLHSTSEIDHSHVQIESRFVSTTSALPHEDLTDLSPAYAATLELLSPDEKLSPKKTKNCQIKTSPRSTRKSTRRLRVRARAQARFIVPIRRALRTLFSRCTFRRGNKTVKAVESNPLYHVDYTFSQDNYY